MIVANPFTGQVINSDVPNPKGCNQYTGKNCASMARKRIPLTKSQLDNLAIRACNELGICKPAIEIGDVGAEVRKVLASRKGLTASGEGAEQARGIALGKHQTGRVVLSSGHISKATVEEQLESLAHEIAHTASGSKDYTDSDFAGHGPVHKKRTVDLKRIMMLADPDREEYYRSPVEMRWVDEGYGPEQRLVWKRTGKPVDE